MHKVGVEYVRPAIRRCAFLRLVEDPRALGRLVTEALRILRELELAVAPPALISA